jgi:hypothetical protein
MKFKLYLKESKSDMEIIGRNNKASMIYAKLSDPIKKEYIQTLKTEKEAYDKIYSALKRGTRGQNLGKMSTSEGFREAMNRIKTELNKAMPNTFTKTHLSVLNKKSVSLKGFGSFPLNDNMDIADYLSAVVLNSKGMTNPDDHKAWFKKDKGK